MSDTKSESEEEDEEEVSGMIRASLRHELRAILDEYPYNGQILKELIQNAEDAGATEIKIILDSEGQGQDTTCPHLNGPSLYVYNDALFTETDWKGITMLRKSVKEDDPLKVGRFGLGFKSVFHITDYPSILSDERVLFIDPRKPESEVCSVHRLRRKGRTVKEMIRSQSDVFNLLNRPLNNNINRFRGTLFRFPLRSVPSALSSLIHTSSSILDLMKACESEFGFVLIFLKSLAKVELIHLQSEAMKTDPIYMKFSVLLPKELSEDRKRQTESLKTAIDNKSVYCSTTDILWEVGQPDLCNSVSSSCKVTNFHLSREDMPPTMQTLCEDSTLSFCPYVGVAFMNMEKRCVVEGHVFCFLPLPLQPSATMTGLPVVVNGFFALSSNRHHLKWPTTDDESVDWEMQKDKACLWNYCLVTEALPKAYRTLLTELKQESRKHGNAQEFISRFYKALPDPFAVNDMWKPLVDTLYADILGEMIFWIKCDGGKWVSVREAIFVLESNADDDEIAATMISLQQNICSVPANVLNAVRHYNSDVTELNPNLVRRILKKSQEYKSLPNHRKLDLLGYILRDIDEDSFPELVDIELIPLADGSFAAFKDCSSSKSPVYIATPDFPISLFPSLENRFMADVPVEIKPQMEKISQFEETCLVTVQNADIPLLIPKVIKGHCTTTWKWVIEFWTMLYRNFSDSLEVFDNLKILPIGKENDFRLSQLTPKSMLVLKRWKDLSLNDDIERFVMKLGVNVVHDIPQEVFKHPMIIGTYVYEPSSKAVLNALINAGAHFKDMISVDTDERQAVLFVSFMCQIPADFSVEEKSLLTSLNIFHVQNQSGKDQHASIQEVKSISSTMRIPVKFCSPILDPATADERVLALKLGGLELPYVDMVNRILDKMAKDDTMYSGEEVKTMLLFLLPQFQGKADINWSLVNKIWFIPCSDNPMAVLKKASDLFDPTDRTLADLLVGEDVFPQQEFKNHISVLQNFGLKTTKDITSDDIFRAAEVIHTNTRNLSDDILQVKSDSVLFHLASIPDMTSDTLAKFMNIKFLPKARKPRHISIHFDWFEDSVRFYSPSCLVAEDLGRLYGSVLPVVKLPDKLTDEQKSCLQDRLQFITLPSLELIVKQLKVTIKCWKCKGNELFNIEGVKCLYKHLAHYETDDVVQIFGHEDMSCKEWVWTGTAFSSPNDVYLTHRENDVSLKPFKYILPLDMSDLSSLLLSFRSEKSQNKTMLLDVLEHIRETLEMKRTDRKQQFLQMTLSILQSLVNGANSDVLEKDDFERILLPVQDEENGFQLKPWGQCVNSDQAPCFLEDSVSEADDPVYYLHEAIPHQLSLALHVPSLMDKLLDTEEVDLNFGQQELLTLRLKNLTSQYTDGMAIVKELIQNADDAKANKICFLYDERENLNARKGLLTKNLSEFQGPALWAFNDAEFSDSDFQNITKISGATKEGDTTKIGRFGLGFNAVYNLTDLPSFISRDIFVIFDPHTTYLEKPGMRFNTKNNKSMMKLLADQFKPFHGVFDCDLSPDRSKSSSGTLFRFPLRTKKQASCSEIRKVAYTRKEMIDLIQLCLGSLGDLLLFTQHVKDFQFYYMPECGEKESNPDLLFAASKTPSEFAVFPEINQTAVQEMKKRYENKQNKSLPQTITISTQVNSQACIELGLHSTDSVRTSWLTNWSTGKDRGREFLETHQNIKGIMPVATVAVPLDLETSPYKFIRLSDNPPGFSKTSFIYNFLPMPIKTKLPVVINGSFVVSSDRQRIVTKSVDEKENTGSEWNTVLLEDSVACAYVDLLLSLKEVLSFHKVVFDLWPTEKHCGEMLQPLLEHFYSTVVLDQPKIVPGLDSWTSFSCSVFLEDSFQPEEIRRKAFGVLQTYFASSGKAVVDMPTSILKLFPESQVVNQTIVINKFYQDIFLPRMDEIDNHTRDELVLFALSSNNAELFETIKITKCILVCNTNNTLSCPADLIHPEGRVAEMYDDTDCRFPSEIFRDHLILETLCQLGMLKNELPNTEIHNRAKYIECLSKSDKTKAEDRFNSLLKILVLPHNNARSLSVEEKSAIANIPFIPVSRRPTDWPNDLAWKGDSMSWASPCAAYSWTKRQLVGCENPVCDEHDIEQENMLSSIGILDMPSPDDVIIQLKQLSNILQLGDQGQDQRQDIYESIYDFIENSDHNWGTKLSNIKHIYVNRRHVEARQIQFSRTRYNCEPYLFYLPHNYARKYWKTMNLFGVKDRFSVDDIRICLKDFFFNFQHNRLQENDIDMLNCIMHLLVQTSKDSGTTINWNDEEIMLPDQTGTQYPLSMLCFNDCSWMDGSTELLYIHNRFSKEVADLLGVKTSQAWCAAENSEGMTVPFGQIEELTTRLKGLLNGYPCDEAIFKELVQNADDAGATRMTFIKDLRDHKKEKVFSNNWKLLQGAALCVFNDKPFSEKDLAGIQSLGKGSKSEDQLKTGKYGVGFNAVYHITDVPSFITKSSDEEILCVLDPNRQYVPNMTRHLSGMRYNKLDIYQKRFPDMFSCYPQKLLEENGTLFRFPLRTKETAAISDIKNEDFTVSKLEQLLLTFQKEAKECILFLKTVRTMQFLKIDDNGEMVLEFEVKASVDEKRQHYNCELQKVAGAFNIGRKLQDIESKTFRYLLKVAEEEQDSKTEYLWYIEQRIGFESVENLPADLLSGFNSGLIGCLPAAGIAFPISPCIFENQKAFRHLPLPIVTGLPVAVDAHFVLDHENRRSIYSSQNQDLSATWNLKLVEHLLAPLYASALLSIIVHTGTTPEQITRYYQHFPNNEKTSGLWKTLSLFTYKYLDWYSSPVLIVSNEKTGGELVQRWLPPTGNAKHKAFFNTLDGQQETSTPPKHSLRRNMVVMDTLTDIIKRLDFNLVDAPKWILLNFKEAEVKVNEVNPTAVIKYLRSHSSAVKLSDAPINIKETSFENKKSLLQLLTYISREVRNLELLPLRLTYDQRLYFFKSSDPVYLSHYHSIWKKSSNTFLDEDAASRMKIAAKVHTEVVPLQISDLDKLLSLEMDSQLLTDRPVEWGSHYHGFPSSTQLRQIWKYLSEEANKRDTIRTQNGIRNILLCLSKWPLIPVTRVFNRGINKYLAPISFANQIINQSQHDISVQNHLQAQGMLTLDTCDLQTGGSLYPEWLLQQMVISIYDAKDLLQGIILMLKTRPQCDSYNQINQLTGILYYLALPEKIEQLQSHPSSKNQLRELPFYLTLFDTPIHLSGREVIMLSNSVPTEGVEEVVRKYPIVWLKYNVNLIELYIYLGVNFKTDIEFYCEYIFASFGELDEHDRMVHLHFIKNTLISSDDGPLQNSLKQLAFIPHTGVLREASYFYDHQHPLFKTMLESNKFVPQPFCQKEWHRLLEVSGLITTVTSELLVSLTRELEEEGTTETSDKTNVKKKSEKLVGYLFEALREALRDGKEKEIADQICKVRFLVSSLGNSKLEMYGRSLQEGDHMICFQNSFNPKYRKLIWTVSEILPNYAINRMPSNCWQALGVQEEPTVGLVVSNLLNIITFIDSNNVLQRRKDDTVMGAVVDIFEEHYRFLQKCIPPPPELKDLTNSKCILIPEHRCLATPDMVVQSLHQKSLKPYLVSQPLEFGPVWKLFQTLGVAEEDSITHYVNVLRIIKESAVENTLHPNEMKVVIEALKAIVETLSRLNEVDDMPDDISPLYLPVETNEGFVLFVSTEVVISDRKLPQSLQMKFRVMANLSETLDQIKLYKLLPSKHRPQLVSEVVVEELTDNCKSQRSDTPTSCRLQTCVRSTEFLNGVVRLLRNKNVAVTESLDGHIETVEQTLCSVRVYSVSVIETQLTHENKVIPDSCTDICNSFATKSGGTSEISMTFTTNYLEDETLETLTSVAGFLCEHLSNIPGMTEAALHIPILLQLVHDDKSVTGYLDRKRIRHFSDHKATKPLLPPAGTFIALDDHALLDANFTFFEKDEYVGYEVCDPLHDDEEGDPVFIYAVIIEEIETPECKWHWQRRYMVNLGQNIVEVSATDLYKLFRKPISVSSGVEIYTGPSTDTHTPSVTDKTLKEEKQQIFEMLKAAWENEEQRKKVIKRLLLAWHPDKNVGNEHLCTKVTQYIMMLLQRFKTGNFGNIETDEDVTDSSGYEDKGFYANVFKRTFRRYRDYHGRHRAHTGGGDEYRANPQPTEGRRWFRQAETDFQSIGNDSSPCWVSFKCQQVVEKALKALVYTNDSNSRCIRSHNLHEIARQAFPNNTTLQDKVDSMLQILGYNCYLSTRYPDTISGLQIPAEVYESKDTTVARRLCGDILQEVRDLLSL